MTPADQLAAENARLRAELRHVHGRLHRRIAVFCRAAWRGWQAAWEAVICDALEVWALMMLAGGMAFCVLCVTPVSFLAMYYLFGMLALPTSFLAVLMLNNRWYP